MLMPLTSEQVEAHLGHELEQRVGALLLREQAVVLEEDVVDAEILQGLQLRRARDRSTSRGSSPSGPGDVVVGFLGDVAVQALERTAARRLQRRVR